MTISVVLPAKNEAGAIGQTIENIKKLPFPIVLYNFIESFFTNKKN